MQKESDKPPDVYPTEPSVLISMFEHLLDREQKQEKHADIESTLQRSWAARVDAAVDRMTQTVTTFLRRNRIRSAGINSVWKGQEGI